MVKRKRVKGLSQDTELAKRLREGAAIAGLEGYAHIADSEIDGRPVFVKVRVLRLSKRKEDRELCVEADILSGYGSFCFYPGQWVDSLKDLAAWVDRELAVRKSHDEYQTIRRQHFVSSKRTVLDKYVKERLTEEQQAAWAENLQDVYEAPNILSKKIPSHKLNELARTAVLVANGVGAGEVSDHDYRFQD